MCLYALNSLDASTVSSLPTTDYLLEAQVGSVRRFFDAHKFTGAEIGRYANQGGLMEGLEELCLACDMASGVESYSRRSVVRVIAEKCQLKFAIVRNSLYLMANHDLRSGSDATELYVDYDIEYWLRYVVDHFQTLDSTNNMVKYVLWTLLSKYSAYSADTNLVQRIPTGVCQQYANMSCPVSHHIRHR